MKIKLWSRSTLGRFRNASRFTDFIVITIIVLQFSCEQIKTPDTTKGNTYYLNTNGNDSNQGTRDNPWKTIEKLNSIELGAGDTASFQGGQVFEGTIAIDSAEF
jgi:hypothetical protein